MVSPFPFPLIGTCTPTPRPELCSGPDRCADTFEDPERRKTPVSAWGHLRRTNPPRRAGFVAPCCAVLRRVALCCANAPARNEPNSGTQVGEANSLRAVQLPRFRASGVRRREVKMCPNVPCGARIRVGKTNPPQPGASTTGVRGARYTMRCAVRARSGPRVAERAQHAGAKRTQSGAGERVVTSRIGVPGRSRSRGVRRSVGGRRSGLRRGWGSTCRTGRTSGAGRGSGRRGGPSR